MEHFDWTFTIKLLLKMLKIVGTWPESNDGYKLDLYTLYSFITINILMNGVTLFQVIGIFMYSSDLEALTSRIFVVSSELLALAKVYYFVMNIKIVKQQIKTLKSEEFKPETEEQITNIQQDLDFWRITYFAFFGPMLITVLLFAMLPILDGSYKNHRFPLSTWYPFDTKKSPIFEIMYLYQIIGVLGLGTAGVNIDMFLTALMMYTGSQCDILCDNLRNLKNKQTLANCFSTKLIDYIKHHKEILSFAENNNKCYNMIILWQILTSALALALTLFQITLIGPSNTEFYSTITYISAVSMEIFLYCLFGNQMEEKSSQIPYAAFESDWTGIPMEAKRNLIIFIIRTQRPIKMSAINLFSLSLATFTTILRTSWSYFAVLRRVNAPE